MSVVVTGASKGIGRATAALMAARGFRVFVGVRTDADAQTLARMSARISPLRLDVTSDAEVEAAARTVAAAAPHGLAGLVNNAGLVVAGPLEALPMDEIRYQFEVNVFGVLRVTRAFLPLLRSARGRIVNVSSINGRVVVPFVAPYAASKFALEALSDGLRMELARQGIHVSVVQPGAVATPIWETSVRRAQRTSAEIRGEAAALYGGIVKAIANRPPNPPARAIPPERVARVIARALTTRRPKARYLVGLDARVGALLEWLLPTRWFDAVRTARSRRRGSLTS
jgi:NAD(P)-dependent dehydrogenase (short-subunit alcohol dehydrogenase family)